MFSGTNLLTICHSASCLFSVVFGFRKASKEIFSELDGTKAKVNILPDTTRRPKGRQGRETRRPHHRVARAHPRARQPMVWGPRGSTDLFFRLYIRLPET